MSNPPSLAIGEEFVWTTTVFFDELDPLGFLHNSRYAVLIQRAEGSFNRSCGRKWESDLSLNPDQFYVVKEQSFRFMMPVEGPCDLSIHMWPPGCHEACLGFRSPISRRTSRNGFTNHRETRSRQSSPCPMDGRYPPLLLPTRALTACPRRRRRSFVSGAMTRALRIRGTTSNSVLQILAFRVRSKP